MKNTFLGAIVVALGLGAPVPFVSWAQDQPQAQREEMRRGARGFGGPGGPGGRMGGPMVIREVMRDLTDAQREQVKAKLPPLSKDATPEQIDGYQKKFMESLRAIRAGTKPGYIFNPQTTAYFRTIIKTEVPPRDKTEIRQTILEADTKGVPLKVNYPYPETKELTQIPPTLLLKLPQLPKEVKYRYVGRHLLLVDTDNNLIIDYMLDALP